MNHELAQLLTTALVQFIDRERPEGTMCCSNPECESIEQMLEGEQFDIVEAFIQKKLSRLTEFEDRLVAFALQCNGEFNVAREEATKWSKELLVLVKKELAMSCPMPEDTILFKKGVEEGRRLEREDMKNELAKKHLEGYIKGREDAEKQYNESVAYHFPIMPTPPSGWGCDGTHCTNPHMDCINCPIKTTGGTITTPNTASGTSTATLHGNTSATDGKEHNPSFTD